MKGTVRSILAAVSLPLLLACADVDEPFGTPTGPRFAATATAVEVQVDPGAYAGRWSVFGVTSFLTGLQAVSLEPGRHEIGVANIERFARFAIDVAGDGTVTVLNGVSAVSGLGTVTFNTTTITIDPGAYTGKWALFGLTGFLTGVETALVVPGVGYGVAVGLLGRESRFTIDVAGDGTVTAANGVSAVGGLGTVTFNTTTITIDPGAYAGGWSIFGITSTLSGVQTALVVPGVSYRLAAVALFQYFSVAEPCAIDPSAITLGGVLFDLTCGPLFIPVLTDIKPGSDPNSINLKGKGSIPVAILTTDDFDAADVDVSTVTLGDDDGNDTGVNKKKNGSFQASLEDADGDGDLDLVLHFDTQDLKTNGDLDANTTELTLNGQTTGGQAIQGSDSVNIVP